MTRAERQRGAAVYRFPTPRLLNSTADDIGDPSDASARPGYVLSLGVAAFGCAGQERVRAPEPAIGPIARGHAPAARRRGG